MTSSARAPAILATIVALSGLHSLHATNGMNMEGYGPISTAMGGASMAFDNGTAAVINNPATLGLQTSSGRLEIALGVLGPDITATSPTGDSTKSQATAFFMPAAGYTKRSGSVVWGFGVFGQGGMGCEYDPASWRGLGFNLENRTEVSVGRFIAPLAWQVNNKLTLAATADLAWAGMDLRMAMSGAQFFDLVTPGQQNFGAASGTLVQSFGQIMQQMPAGTSVDYAYFDFNNGSPLTGKARGYGYAAKLGLHYQASDRFAFGVAYHSRTALSDLKASGQSLSFQLNVPGMGAVPQALTGDYRVVGFEWPAMFAAGFSWAPSNRWSMALDVRHVMWSSVMKDFHMTFDAGDAAENGPFAGNALDARLYQDWDDQTIVMLGFSYAASSNLTLRFGGNIGSNPVPDRYLNCLFPAVIEKHVTAGFGYRVGERSSIDFSLTRGLKFTTKSGYGVGIEHSQLNGQMVYSVRF